MTDEIFGPILPVLTVQSLDEAITFVNSRPKPLAAYLFTKAKSVRERVIKEVPAGGMLVNHLALPVRHDQAAVRRCRPVGHGCLPRQVRVRGVQPPQVGADQADPTRLIGA